MINQLTNWSQMARTLRQCFAQWHAQLVDRHNRHTRLITGTLLLYFRNSWLILGQCLLHVVDAPWSAHGFIGRIYLRLLREWSNCMRWQHRIGQTCYYDGHWNIGKVSLQGKVIERKR